MFTGLRAINNRPFNVFDSTPGDITIESCWLITLRDENV